MSIVTVKLSHSGLQAKRYQTDNVYIRPETREEDIQHCVDSYQAGYEFEICLDLDRAVKTGVHTARHESGITP